MIKFEHTEVVGWEHAIRGMRNPYSIEGAENNSWDKSDSHFHFGEVLCKDCAHTDKNPCGQNCLDIGPNDHDLMMRLANGGPVHAKYRRMIIVYVDITAPLYWWKEFDTYKVGTVANSCSTMHKIAAKEFTLDDFSCEHLEDLIGCNYDDSLLIDVSSYHDDSNLYSPAGILTIICKALNRYRERYLETKDKRYWWQMIQLLPSSYNQKRTVELNYEVLNNIYHSRKDHKLDEWREFCKWIESLPYSEIINPEKEDLRILIDPGKIPVDEFKKLIGIVNKAYGKNCEEQENLEHLIDISRPGSDHPHYVIGLGVSENDLTDYEKDLLKKSDEYWKNKE